MKKGKIFIVASAVIFMAGSVVCAEAQKTPRIKGGQEAEALAWPWMAALVNADQSDAYKGHFCGASLIHPRWVITAAHCVKNVWGLDSDPDDIDVVLGVNDLRDNLKGERIGVKRVVSHPDYDYLSEDADIALLELRQASSYAPVPIVSGEASVLMLSGESSADWENGMAMGWGFADTDDQWEYPYKLQQVTLPIVSNDICNEAYTEEYEWDDGWWWLAWLFGYDEEDEQVTDSMMCAGYSDGFRDACSGDSGGPLLVEEEDSWKVAGIVSWGQRCDDSGSYGVYTRVSVFTDFIAEHLSKDYFACADYDSDGEVDRKDLSDKITDAGDVFDDWVRECWRPKADCGDYNDNGIVSTRDRIEKFWDDEQELDDWIQECWIPEL